MSKVSDYMTLPSNASMDVYPQNTLANYRVKLPRKYEFSEEVEVALVEFSYTKSWRRESEIGGLIKFKTIGNYPDLIEEMLENALVPVHLPEHDYARIEELVIRINSVIENVAGFIDLPYVEYLSHHNKIKIHEGTFGLKSPANGDVFSITVGPIFSEKIEKYLELSVRGPEHQAEIEYYRYNNGSLYDEMHSQLREVNVDGDIKMLFVYSNLTYPSVVGDTTAQLLRTTAVTREVNQGDQVAVIFQTPHYLRLLRKTFDEIEIDIKDSTGNHPKFLFGRTSVTLHFKSRDG
jgi:hypothetical protein